MADKQLREEEFIELFPKPLEKNMYPDQQEGGPFNHRVYRSGLPEFASLMTRKVRAPSLLYIFL